MQEGGHAARTCLLNPVRQPCSFPASGSEGGLCVHPLHLPPRGFPLVTWSAPPTCRPLGEELVPGQARARRGLAAEARTPFSGFGHPAGPARRGPHGIGEDSPGGTHGPGRAGRGEPTSRPPPPARANGTCRGQGRQGSPQNSSPTVPSAFPGPLCSPGTREGSVTPQRGSGAH